MLQVSKPAAQVEPRPRLQLDIEHRYRGTRLVARIEAADRITFGGSTCESLSLAGGIARRLVVGAPPGREYPQTNGWTFWEYGRADGTLGQLDELRRALYEYTIEAEGAPAFLAEVWGEASRRPLIRDLMARRYERGITMTSIMLRECVEHGELPADIDVDGLARTIGALTDGMVLEYVVSGGSLRFEDAQQRIRLVLDAAIAMAAAA